MLFDLFLEDHIPPGFIKEENKVIMLANVLRALGLCTGTDGFK